MSEQGKPGQEEMKTTAVVLSIHGDRAVWGHIGDSRLYRFSGGTLIQETRDHSVTFMKYLGGEISYMDICHDDDRSSLLRALGKQPCKPEAGRAELRPGDAFLLCSDGFWEYVYQEEMLADLLKAETPDDEEVTRLHTAISQALDYFEGMPRERNELRCMVILSDAVQYDPRGGVPYEELLERVSQSDVMLHSVGLGTDRESLDSLGRLASASGGIHQEADIGTAEEAAIRLTESGGGLYVTGFDLSGYTSQGGAEQMSVTFASGGELICRAEARVELPELDGTPGTQTTPSLPEMQEPSTGGTTAAPPAPSGGPASSGGPGLPLLAAAAAGALVLIAVVVVVFKRK